MKIDPSLLRKYDRSGPRYTSYPTAPQFRANFTWNDVAQQLMHPKADAGRPLSLYVHVPFCPSICHYCACNTTGTSERDRIAAYVESVLQEIRHPRYALLSKRKAVQIHFGGGTPTHAGIEALGQIVQALREQFQLTADAEISIELDPRGIKKRGLEALRAIGFNRVSFGIQDIDEQVQRAVNRVQPQEMCVSLINECRNLGFESINVDIIYGLPHQTLESHRRTVQFVTETLQADRIAAFNFAYVPWLKKNQEAIAPETLPSPDLKLQLLQQIIESITEAGYDFIGMDHFARPADKLAQAARTGQLHRNFQGYTIYAGVDILGFGATSISEFETVYCQNVKTDAAYREHIEKEASPLERGIVLTPEDVLRRSIIMAILCNGTVDKQAVSQRFGVDFNAYFAKELAQLATFREDGLLWEDSTALRVVPEGRLFLRNMAMVFDAYLGAATETPMYSRTV